MDKPLSYVICIVGATGSGKTNISIQLAQHLQAHIINLDSVQIYKELNIGSAKPTMEERKLVPHYLIDIASITEPQNSFTIFQKAYSLIQEMYGEQNIIITGGTGLYYKALLWGMFSSSCNDVSYRQDLQIRTTETLYEILRAQDPRSAQKIHPNDKIRIIRALEVFHVTGQSIIDLQKQESYRPPAPFLLVGLEYERSILYQKINQRVLDMMQDGLLEELKSIQSSFQGIPPLLRKIIGYKEFIPYLEGTSDLAKAISDIQQNTRRFAKRQLTLFRHIPNIKWFTEPKIKDILDYIKVQESTQVDRT